jgi:hypothetical protein
VLFLLLLAAHQLPPTFARSAGWGDILIGVLALPIAWAIERRARGWWWATLIWSVFATGDLISAVSLGVGSIAGSPVRFVFESVSSGAVTTLPWALIPVYLVPIYLFTLIAVFGRLAESARERHGAMRPAPRHSAHELHAH